MLQAMARVEFRDRMQIDLVGAFGHEGPARTVAIAGQHCR